MHDHQHAESSPRLAIFYEHPEWFTSLFAELDRRGVDYDRLLAHEHCYDPTERRSRYKLIVNRMSPSAYTRGHEQAIFHNLTYMAHLKEIGANVVNGYDAYSYGFNKARQLVLMKRLGLRHPPTRVVNHPSQVPQAARDLNFPVLVKPNIGGRGTNIVRFDTPGELLEAASRAELDFGVDHTALVQEYIPPRDGSVVRVEIMGGKLFYALRFFPASNEFNLCPGDFCRRDVPKGHASDESGRVEGYTPPDNIVADVVRILAAASIDVGAVEYLESARDGRIYFYDINALSTFVANAQQVIGFDPVPRFVDYVLERAGMTEQAIVA